MKLFNIIGKLFDNISRLPIYLASIGMFACFAIMILSLSLINNEGLFLIMTLTTSASAGIGLMCFLVTIADMYEKPALRDEKTDSSERDEEFKVLIVQTA